MNKSWFCLIYTQKEPGNQSVLVVGDDYTSLSSLEDAPEDSHKEKGPLVQSTLSVADALRSEALVCQGAKPIAEEQRSPATDGTRRSKPSIPAVMFLGDAQ